MYRASKAALNIVSKSMALDLSAQGVSCVLLHPGASHQRVAATGGGGDCMCSLEWASLTAAPNPRCCCCCCCRCRHTPTGYVRTGMTAARAWLTPPSPLPASSLCSRATRGCSTAAGTTTQARASPGDVARRRKRQPSVSAELLIGNLAAPAPRLRFSHPIWRRDPWSCTAPLQPALGWLAASAVRQGRPNRWSAPDRAQKRRANAASLFSHVTRSGLPGLLMFHRQPSSHKKLVTSLLLHASTSTSVQQGYTGAF
jgi:hypothetical protein